MIIVGEKEIESSTISVRKHGGEDLGNLKIEKFADHVDFEISKTLRKF